MRGDPAALTNRGRSAARQLMTLELTAYAPGTVADENDRLVPGGVPQGTVCGKVAGPSSQSGDTGTRTVVVGGVERPVLVAGLHIPLDAFVDDDNTLLIKAGERTKGWEFVVTKVGRGADPTLKGRRYLVVGVPAKSFATARRLDVVEV